MLFAGSVFSVFLQFSDSKSLIFADEAFRFSERVELAHVHKAQVLFLITMDVVVVAHCEIEVNYAELVGKISHQGEQAWREYMDA